MLSNPLIAREVSKLMLEFGAELDATLVKVQSECSTQEFTQYRTAVGKVMGEMLLEIMNPLYDAHPNLKPKELD
jgi:hypothetical protein